jgi:hypothetical protein
MWARREVQVGPRFRYGGPRFGPLPPTADELTLALSSIDLAQLSAPAAAGLALRRVVVLRQDEPGRSGGRGLLRQSPGCYTAMLPHVTGKIRCGNVRERGDIQMSDHEGSAIVDQLRATWHVSTFSANGGGGCVEAGPLSDGTERIAVRHSRRPEEAVILYTRSEWDAFLAGVRSGEFDFPRSTP